MSAGGGGSLLNLTIVSCSGVAFLWPCTGVVCHCVCWNASDSRADGASFPALVDANSSHPFMQRKVATRPKRTSSIVLTCTFKYILPSPTPLPAAAVPKTDRARTGTNASAWSEVSTQQLHVPTSQYQHHPTHVPNPRWWIGTMNPMIAPFEHL